MNWIIIFEKFYTIDESFIQLTKVSSIELSWEKALKYYIKIEIK